MNKVYTPDKWVILEINNKGDKVRKVLAGFQGGYLDGDAWRLSSGTVETEEDGDYFLFHQHSGSTYKCHKQMEAFTVLTASMHKSWQEQVKDLENVTIKRIEITKDDEEKEA